MSKKVTVKKNAAEKLRCRKWTEEEMELFAAVLTDDENCFAANLERLAFKKSANNEVFLHVKKIFDRELKKDEFKIKNEESNFTRRGVVFKYDELDTSIDKIRRKYSTMKTEWRKLSERAKLGSGLAPEKEPKWYQLVNVVFSETNEILNLADDAADLSYLQDEESDVDVEADNASFASEDGKKAEKSSKAVENSASDASDDEEESGPSQIKKAAGSGKRKGKVVAAPHLKRKVVRSQQHALSNLANSVDKMASIQLKKHKERLDYDLKREEMYLQFKREEAEKNREHELKLAEMYARGAQQQQFPATFSSPPIPRYQPSTFTNLLSPLRSAHPGDNSAHYHPPSDEHFYSPR